MQHVHLKPPSNGTAEAGGDRWSLCSPTPAHSRDTQSCCSDIALFGSRPSEDGDSAAPWACPSASLLENCFILDLSGISHVSVCPCCPILSQDTTLKRLPLASLLPPSDAYMHGSDQLPQTRQEHSREGSSLPNGPAGTAPRALLPSTSPISVLLLLLAAHQLWLWSPAPGSSIAPVPAAHRALSDGPAASAGSGRTHASSAPVSIQQKCAY